MAKARKEEIRTEKIHLELDSLEASVLSAILCQDTGYESADAILGALTEAGVAPFGDVTKAVFAPLSRPNHYAHDSLGDPATCTGDHNHPINPADHLVPGDYGYGEHPINNPGDARRG